MLPLIFGLTLWTYASICKMTKLTTIHKTNIPTSVLQFQKMAVVC